MGFLIYVFFGELARPPEFRELILGNFGEFSFCAIRARNVLSFRGESHSKLLIRFDLSYKHVKLIKLGYILILEYILQFTALKSVKEPSKNLLVTK